MSTHPDSPLLANQPTLCTAQHSILQQERLYLLRALADEERRKERLTSTLKKIQGSLDLATSEPVRQTKVLRKKLRAVRSKLKRSKGTSRALCNNLDALMAQMQRLDGHQWHRTHHDYAQQTQHGLMTSLSPRRLSAAMGNPSPLQQFGRDTMPPSPFGHHQYQPVVQQLFTNPMEQALRSPIPPTPILRPVQFPNTNTNLNPFSFSSPPRRRQQSTSILRTNINPLCPSEPSSPFSLSYNFDSLSPTDTISTFSLNPNLNPYPNQNQSPWIPAPTVATPWPSPGNWNSNSFIPPTQVFDLVQGLGTMSLASRRENQNSHRYQNQNRNLDATGLSRVWVCAPPPPQLSPLLSASMAMAMASSPRGAEMNMQDVGEDVDMEIGMGVERGYGLGQGYGYDYGYGYTPSPGYGSGYGHGHDDASSRQWGGAAGAIGKRRSA